MKDDTTQRKKRNSKNAMQYKKSGLRFLPFVQKIAISSHSIDLEVLELVAAGSLSNIHEILVLIFMSLWDKSVKLIGKKEKKDHNDDKKFSYLSSFCAW